MNKLRRLATAAIRLSAILFALVIAPAAAAQTTYKYDSIGRLTSAKDSAGAVVNYGYDKAGNIVSVGAFNDSPEIVPTSFLASSNRLGGTTGLETSNGMRDRVFSQANSLHVTNADDPVAWIRADLGVAKNVHHVDLAPPDSQPAINIGNGPAMLNGAVVERSLDGTNWTTVGTVSAPTGGAYISVAFAGASARYIRVRKNSDGSGQTWVGLGDFRVYAVALGPNQSPIAVDDVLQLPANETSIFYPMVNDSDPDGDPLVITSATNGTHGDVDRQFAGNFVVYKPKNKTYTGPDQFTYTISDGRGGTAPGRVNVTITAGVNRPPIFRPGAMIGTSQGALKEVDLGYTIYDPDGDTLVMTVVTAPAHGTLVHLGGTTFRYTPSGSYTGADEAYFSVSDGQGGQASGRVGITISQAVVNRAPIAMADTRTVSKGGTLIFDPRINDSDPDGEPIYISAVASQSNGIATPSSGRNSITFQPTTSFAGVASFTYYITDDHGGTAYATVTVNVVDSSNSAPTAVADQLTTPKGASNYIDVLANDYDENGDVLTITSASAPYGTVSVYDGKLNYNPGSNPVNNPEIINYTISDGRGKTASSTVTVTILVQSSNRLPVARGNWRPNGGTILEYVRMSATAIDVMKYDTDEDGDPLTLVAVDTSLRGGTVTRAGNRAIYTPPANLEADAEDYFRYYITDGHGTWVESYYYVHVNPQHTVSAPTISSASAVVPAGTTKQIQLLPTGTYHDIWISGIPAGQGLYATMSNTGLMTVSPPLATAGTTLSYTIAIQVNGTSLSVPYSYGTVTVTVPEIIQSSSSPLESEPPTVVNDSFTVPFATATAMNVLANDSGANLAVTSVSSGAHGTIQNNGSYVTYTPHPNYVGNDSFSYWVNSRATGNVSVNVSPPPNNNPVAISDSYTVPYGAVATLAVRGNDTDQDGDALIVSSKTNPAHGAVTIGPNGANVTYVPTAGYSGSDSFTYTVSDGRGGTSTATVSITVSANTNVNPVAAADTATVAMNGAVVVDVLANDTDSNSDVLTITTAGTPGHGATRIEGGKIVYTPTTDYVGADNFTYAISDGHGGTATGAVSVTVTGAANRAPLLVDDAKATAFGVATSLNVLANDNDPDGDTLTVSSVTTPAHGTATIGSGGSVTYTPASGYVGIDSFNYTVSDGKGGTASAKVTITVGEAGASSNEFVAWSASSAQEGWDGNTGVPFAKTFYGNYQGYATLQVQKSPPSGSANFNGVVTEPGILEIRGANGNSQWDIAGGERIGAAFQVKGLGAVSHAALSFQYWDANWQGLPESTPIALAVSEWSRVETAVTTPANARHVGLVLRVTAMGDQRTQPMFGALIRKPQFHRLAMGQAVPGWPDPAQANTTPVAANDSYDIAYNASAQALNVRSNDTDADNDPLVISGITQPSHGVSAIVGGASVSYTPTSGYGGADSFTYTVSDGRGGTATATVTLDVAYPSTTNEFASFVTGNVEDGWDGNTGVPYTRTTSANYQGWPILTLQKTTTTGSPPNFNGTVSEAGEVQLRGLANNDTWEVTGGQRVGIAFEAKALGVTSHARLKLIYWDENWQDVTPSSPVSVAISDWSRVELVTNVPSAARHVAAVLMLTSMGEQTAASVHGAMLRKPQFYKLTSGQPMPAYPGSPLANGQPSAANDSYSIVYETATNLSVRTNDTDPDQDALAITSVTTPGHGTAVINGGATVTYTPATGYVGSDSFTYTVSDGRGGTSTATVSLTVAGPPIANLYVNFNTSGLDNWWDGGTSVPYTASTSTEDTFAVLTLQKEPTTTPNYNGTVTVVGDIQVNGATGGEKWDLTGGERIGVAYDATPIGAGTHLAVRFHYWDENWGDLGDSAVTSTAISSWTRAEHVATAPSGARHVGLVLSVQATGDQTAATLFGVKLRKPQFSILPGSAPMPAYQ